MGGPVFISYSHRDDHYVGRLTRHLAAAGLQIWTDQGIPRGAQWVRTIDEQVRACSVLVPVMSPRSQVSDWVTNEILLAQDLGKPIMPLLLDGRPFTALLSLQHEDVRGGRLPSAAFIEGLARISGVRLRADLPVQAGPTRPAPEQRSQEQRPPEQRSPETGQAGSEADRPVRRGGFRRRAGVAGVLAAVALTIGCTYGVSRFIDVFEPDPGRTTSGPDDDGAPVLRHGGAVLAAVWSPDGSRLATAGYADTRVWDATTAQTIHTIDVATAHVAWSPTGDRLALAGSPAQVWDAVTGQRIVRLGERTEDYARDVVWAPAGTQLATVGFDIRIWDAASGDIIRTLVEDTELVTAVAWSPDGGRLATAGYDNTVTIWDTATGRVVHALAGHTERINDLAWSPDGGRLATAGGDSTARIWDTATGRVVHALAGHTERINDLAWSPDGEQLATASGDDTARIWDTATGEATHTLAGHTDDVTALAWSSPDGEQLATASGDSTARVWDASTGQSLETLAGHNDEVTCVAWSRDGTKLATASTDNTARIWPRDG